MKQFLEKIKPLLKTAKVIKFSSRYNSAIQNIVCELLNVKSVFELNDKFEGVRFHEKYSNEVFGFLTVEKFLNDVNPDINKVSHKKDYCAYIEIKKKKIRIITSNFREFPIIERKKIEPTIFVLKKDHLNFWIIGVATKKVLKTYLANNTKEKSKKTIFTDFDKLETFENSDELSIIVDKNQ